MLSAQNLKDLFGEATPERALQKARRLASRGKPDQALQYLKEAVGRLGESAELRLEMATLQITAGRPREAAEALRALLKADAAQVDRVEEFVGWARGHRADIQPLYETLAEGYVTRRNFNAALDTLEKIDKKALEGALASRLANLKRFLEKGTIVPKSAMPTLYLAALAQEALGDWQKAFECYARVLAAVPSEFTAVDERLRGLVARHYKQTPVRLGYADMLDRSGHADRAREEHLKALEIDARCAPQVGRFLEERLAASPEDESLLWDLAQVRRAEGRTDQALALWHRLADRRARLPEVERALDDLAAAGKDSLETQLLMAKVARAQARPSRAVAALVSALAGDGGERAIAALAEVIQEFPAELRPYQILADHHLRNGRIDRCLEVYRDLRRADAASAATIGTKLQAVLLADPENEEALEMLEEVSLQSGDLRAAVPFLRRRLRRGPEEARAALGRLRALLAENPGEAPLVLAAAEACLAAGDPAGAWGHLEDLIDPSRSGDAAFLHLVVLAAGSSPEAYRRAVAAVASRAPQWRLQPEAEFALAEAAGRAGQIRDAVEGFRCVAAACPEAAHVCHEAVRGLARQAASAATRDPRERGALSSVLAEALLDAGDAVGAADALRAAGALPTAAAARLSKRLTEALRADKENLPVRAALVEVLAVSGQSARALEVARAGLAGREDAATAPLVMAYAGVLLRAGRLGEATRACLTAARRDAVVVPEAIVCLRRILAADRGLDAAHLALGRLLLHAGETRDGVVELMSAWSSQAGLGPQVLKDLERADRQAPGDVEVARARARILSSQGDPTAAAVALGAALGPDPTAAAPLIAAVEALVEEHPGCARVQLVLGRTCALMGQADRAAQCARRAHEVDASLGEEIAVLLADLEGRFPESSGPRLARASLYEAQGKAQAAADTYLEVAGAGGAPARDALDGLRRLCAAGRQAPAPLHLARARACRLTGQALESAEAARQALESSPELAPIVRQEMDALAATLEGDPQAAARARVLLARAEAARRLNDFESAARDAAAALRADAAAAAWAAPLLAALQERRPLTPATARVLAEAFALSGDAAAAARCLEAALREPGGARDLDLILARRALAAAAGDRPMAQELTRRAEAAASSRDDLLARLHAEVLARAGAGADSWQLPAGARGPLAAGVAAALERSDYATAAASLGSAPAGALKAWVLARGGRPAEAAACLEEMGASETASSALAALRDRYVARELEGRAEALMAEAPIRFEAPAVAAAREPSRRKAAAAAVSGPLGGET